MKMILKSALAAAAIVGATSVVPGLAFAGVGLSIGIGLPGPVFGPAYAPCGPDYGPCGDGYNPLRATITMTRSSLTDPGITARIAGGWRTASECST